MRTNNSKRISLLLFQDGLEPNSLTEAELQDFFEAEESLFNCLRFFQDKEISEFPNEFSMDLELENLDSDNPLPLPKYLQNYINLSFENQKQESSKVSFVLKLAKDRLKLLGGLFDPSFQVLPSLDTSVRSKEVDLTQTLHLEEKESTYQVHYQIIRENENQVYLSIHFPKNQKISYEQVILRKNGRFIYASQIGEKGIVSFSGLQEGQYTIEFLGKKSSKSIDITILLDHP